CEAEWIVAGWRSAERSRSQNGIPVDDLRPEVAVQQTVQLNAANVRPKFDRVSSQCSRYRIGVLESIVGSRLREREYVNTYWAERQNQQFAHWKRVGRKDFRSTARQTDGYFGRTREQQGTARDVGKGKVSATVRESGVAEEP